MQNIPPDNSNYLLLTQVVKDALTPLAAQVSRLTDKVDALSSDHATKDDIKDLRGDMNSNFVRKDVHEQQVSELRTCINEMKSNSSLLLSRVSLVIGIIATLIAILSNLHLFGH